MDIFNHQKKELFFSADHLFLLNYFSHIYPLKITDLLSAFPIFHMKRMMHTSIFGSFPLNKMLLRFLDILAMSAKFNKTIVDQYSIMWKCHYYIYIHHLRETNVLTLLYDVSVNIWIHVHILSMCYYVSHFSLPKICINEMPGLYCTECLFIFYFFVFLG